MNPEKRVSIAILCLSMLASVVALASSGSSLAQENVIEISRNTPIVQKAINANLRRIYVETWYWSRDYIMLKRGELQGAIERVLPDDHGVWWVHWVNDAPGYHITHFIDELSGEILYELVVYSG